MFVKEFTDLYKYYKDTRLARLKATENKLFAVFQVSAALEDVKIFHWNVLPRGGVRYVDNRGDREFPRPPSHDFEWTATSRDDHVSGQHPHVNIKDLVFVETVGGDLTIKIENNTKDGLGIYREPVEDANQALDDAKILYCIMGPLVLLKIQPYRETKWRYFIYNTRTKSVSRIDAIGQSCMQLPEDHGVVFPGGYYLRTGDTKQFGTDSRLRVRAAHRLAERRGRAVRVLSPRSGQVRAVPVQPDPQGDAEPDPVQRLLAVPGRQAGGVPRAGRGADAIAPDAGVAHAVHERRVRGGGPDGRVVPVEGRQRGAGARHLGGAERGAAGREPGPAARDVRGPDRAGDAGGRQLLLDRPGRGGRPRERAQSD
jgi:hypothetical protein